MEKFGDQFYLVANEVFNISGPPQKLSPVEVEDLPVIISWRGGHFNFDIDEKACFELLCSIVSDMNLMQHPGFVSFPLGKSI